MITPVLGIMYYVPVLCIMYYYYIIIIAFFKIKISKFAPQIDEKT
jgi:hypothetical protein